MFRLRQESALNLSLEGTVGSFSVGTGRPGQHSLEVKYFLTHVGLNFASGPNDALLSALAPVREIFDFASLDFDEIMQRDIDDARVSAELIPYLLDEQSTDLIKLFPPVVVAVLPVEEGRNTPSPYYPDVVQEDLPQDTQREYDLRITRSGPIGREAFQFEQPIADGQPLAHDMVRLRLNTHRTRLVIVDGQHRAMALLAIYRNLKDQWSDERRAPFREYYSEWTPNYINQFNLTHINLPVMLCTVPTLDARYSGGYDLKKAARSIFLTLNKTARKVSDSRNKLLDDNDLIANLMRRCLSEIKQKDNRSSHSLRIWNIELDQFGDRMKLQSPIAITGVNHIYYLIEHAMLDSGDVSGVAPRSGKFYKRTNLTDCLDRLDGRNILGAVAADAIKRDSFSVDAAEKLGGSFDQRYGSQIIGAFERFAPYDRHNRAVLALEAHIDKHMDRQLHPILFEGQGIWRVFEAHRDNLKQKLKDGYFRADVPEIEESARRLDATAERIRNAVVMFRSERAQLFVSGISDRRALRTQSGELHQRVIEWVNGLFDNVLTTVAFQAALTCGFLGEFEKASSRAEDPALDMNTAFDEYIIQISEFFVPSTAARFRKLVQVFIGEIAGDAAEDWKVSQSNQTFRSVVYRAEMQPDQWPKYKYLLLEVWNPSHGTLAEGVELERQKCRAEVFSALYDSYRKAHCRENRKLEEDLTKGELGAIFNQAFDAYNGLLRNLGARQLERGAMKTAISTVPATAAAEVEEEPDIWVEMEDERA